MTAWAQDMLVDSTGFTIPVSRSLSHHDIMTSTHTLEVRTVSLAGELLDVALIVLESYANLRMFAFAR